MRRKSERAPSKKAKVSPDKKVEKSKRTRSKRTKKQSTSSENEAADDTSPSPDVVVEVGETEKKPPSTPAKEDSPEEAQDQVWQVKTAETSGDVGEIQKLKICLTRPPSTPERVDRSPRSKRKHSRATSSSDTPSVEGSDEKKSKTKHRSKRAARESKDETDKNHDSHEEEPEAEMQEKSSNEVSQSTDVQSKETPDETPMSTTTENKKDSESEAKDCEFKDETNKSEKNNESRPSDADTTVDSTKDESQDSSSEIKTCSNSASPVRDRSESVDKSEVLEIHVEDSKLEEEETKKEKLVKLEGKEQTSDGQEGEVSISGNKSASEEAESTQSDTVKASNKNDVVENSKNKEKRRMRKYSSDSEKDKEEHKDQHRNKDIEHSDSTQKVPEEIQNEQSAPFVVSRKRRWGARPKLTSQKSITISTDVLKEIIPDVKPVEFDEVIEEKKHKKRVEVPDKIERPVLPKIVIDNSENVEQHRKELEKENEEVAKKESLGTNRKISIVKENDSILTRPPSPPRHKQSNILYITNLVRPFTLPQLKNLLQRTGRIVENGFWIDRIKSKCFVKYESEDQAVETRHALHGVTWPVSNPKTLQVDFSTQEAFDKAKNTEEIDNSHTPTTPGTVEDWLREQDMKRDRGELEKPFERKSMREWDMGKNEKDKEKDRLHRDAQPIDRRRHRSPDRSPEPAKKFKKKEEEAPAKLLDDLFRKTKTTPSIYWLPLSAETIAIKEEQRRQHMAEHERRLQELRRTHRRH